MFAELCMSLSGSVLGQITHSNTSVPSVPLELKGGPSCIFFSLYLQTCLIRDWNHGHSNLKGRLFQYRIFGKAKLMARKGKGNPWLEHIPGQSEGKGRQGEVDLLAHFNFFLPRESQTHSAAITSLFFPGQENSLKGFN